jgi:hypothetical protein
MLERSQSTLEKEIEEFHNILDNQVVNVNKAMLKSTILQLYQTSLFNIELINNKYQTIIAHGEVPITEFRIHSRNKLLTMENN